MRRPVVDPFAPKKIVMPADFAQDSTRLAGPKCATCDTREARCAFKRGCCEACTHDFAEPRLPKVWAA